MAQSECLAGDKPRLRHRPLDRVHQQQHAIDHRQHALHLAAEVRMSGRVDDIDTGAAVLDGAVLGEDGDAALALDVIGVHDPLAHLLMRFEGSGLFEQAIHQRRLAMVDVRDDCDVSDGAVHELVRGSQKGREDYQKKATTHRKQADTAPESPRLAQFRS